MRAEKSLLLPFLLSKIGLTFLCQFCPSRTQSIATVPANVYNCPCKALRPLPQTLALFASNACGKRRLHLGFPSSHVLPTGPKEDGIIIAGREGGVPNASAQRLYPLVQPLFFPQEQEINCYRKKGWPKWQVFSRRMSNFAQKLERMLSLLFIILHQQENKRKYE